MRNELFRCYLILFNITKPINFGNLIRTANAFGATPIAVGKKEFSRCGANAGTRLTKVLHYYSLEQACEFVRSENCSIVGVEIDAQAKPVAEHPFHGSTAFMMGNEGEGLLPKQLQICDELVYVPQHGTAACLNVNVAAGIVLHHFATWAGFPEAAVVDHHFRPTESVASIASMNRQRIESDA